MVVRIKFKKLNGLEFEDRLSLKEERRGLIRVSENLFNEVVRNERDNVMMMLVSRFVRLRFEDLEEVYDDGCLVLWEKMMDEEFEVVEKSVVGLLRRICRNIGMHYLRKVNDDLVSLDRIMEEGCWDGDEDEGLSEMFDVLDDSRSDEEMYERLDEVWNKLKKVDRMILESYYVEGCKLDEIAKRVGYKNGNTVKSKKDKVLKRMVKMMKEEPGDDSPDLPLVA